VLFKEPFEQHLDLYSAVLDWDLSWASLTAVASWQKGNFSYSQDVTPLYGALLGTGTLFPFEVTTFDEVQKDYEEVRLTSRPDAKWDWQLGLFYTREEGTAVNHVYNHFCADGSFPIPIATPPYLLCAGIPMFDGYVPSIYTEYGAYGDATVHVTSALDLTLGVRYAYNKQDYEQQFTGLLNNPLDPLTPTITKTHSDDSVVTYLFNPAYHLTEDSSVYLRIASGYRAGGPNLVFYDGSGQPNAPLSFGSDTIWSYDLGTKNVFLGGTLVLDFSLFHVDWQDIQQFGVINGAGATINAGKAKIDGAELSGSYRITQGLTVSGFMSYIDARMAADAPVIGAQDGQQLPISPKFSGSLDVDYRFPIGDRVQAFAGLTDRYVGDRNAGYDGSLQAPQYLLDAYNVIDGRVGVEFNDFTVQLFIKNATNEAGEISADMSNTTFNPSAAARVALVQPRTIGLQVTYDFASQPK
jgi:outer membrane receptor protein involved in Fe transport